MRQEENHGLLSSSGLGNDFVFFVVWLEEVYSGFRKGLFGSDRRNSGASDCIVYYTKRLAVDLSGKITRLKKILSLANQQ